MMYSASFFFCDVMLLASFILPALSFDEGIRVEDRLVSVNLFVSWSF